MTGSVTLPCVKTAGFGWNINGVIEDVDDHGKFTLPPFKKYWICSQRNLVKSSILVRKVVVS